MSWSRDSRTTYYPVLADPGLALVSRPADGSSGEITLVRSSLSLGGGTTPPDGSALVYWAYDNESFGNIMSLARGDTVPKPVLASDQNESDPAISPDGRWLAFGSGGGQRGETHVYVRPFPNVMETVWQVSPEPGIVPRWSPDGRELFYQTEDNTIVAVEVLPGSTFSMGRRRTVLSLTPYLTNRRAWGVGNDGRLMVVKRLGPPPNTRIVVTQNLATELRGDRRQRSEPATGRGIEPVEPRYIRRERQGLPQRRGSAGIHPERDEGLARTHRHQRFIAQGLYLLHGPGEPGQALPRPDGFRPEPEHDGSVARDGGRGALGQPEHETTRSLERRPVPPNQRPPDLIHGGSPQEPGHEQVGRPVVDVERRADLLHPSLVHHHDPVAKAHRLDLIVGDVHRGGAEAAAQRGDLPAHLDPELGVEVGERLVEQEDLGMPDDRPPQCHPLALAAGELLRLPVEQLTDTQQLRGLLHPGVDRGSGQLPELERKAQVVPDREVGIQGIILEYHRDVAIARGHVVDNPVPDPDGAGRGRLQSRDHPQGGGLPAAGGTDQHQELALADLEIDAVDGHMNRAPVLVYLPDACQLYSCPGNALRRCRSTTDSLPAFSGEQPPPPTRSRVSLSRTVPVPASGTGSPTLPEPSNPARLAMSRATTTVATRAMSP